MTESWLPIPGYPGYEVSDMGRVRSYKIKGSYELAKTPHILSPSFSKKGYPGVLLRANGQSYFKNIHQLVMLAFIGPCPEGLEVCHGPGGPGNSQLSNLRYDTHLGNMQDAVKSGSMAKIKPEQVAEIRELRAANHSIRTIAERYNVSKPTISQITTGRSRRRLPGNTVNPYQFKHQRANRIRQAYATGRYTMTELAKEEGMHLSAISLIIKNKRCIESPKEQL